MHATETDYTMNYGNPWKPIVYSKYMPLWQLNQTEPILIEFLNTINALKKFNDLNYQVSDDCSF